MAYFVVVLASVLVGAGAYLATVRLSREEAVPGRRLSYRLVSGMALDGYRADVDLTPDGAGTVIRWHSTFTAKRPWMGGFYQWFLGRFIKGCAEGLAKAAAR